MSVNPPIPSQAKRIAEECQYMARVLGNHQNDQLTLKASQVTLLVTALLNAGNVLAVIDKLDPAQCNAPVGWRRTTGFDPDGRLYVQFTQLEPKDVPVQVEPPPMPETYGHPG